MSKGLVIAIDGPAGAGKSTVAKILAKRLNLHYLDTGAMYRVLALKATRAGLKGDQGAAAAELFGNSKIEFADGDPQRVLLDGEDITSTIRTPEIAELASALSTHSSVRQIMVAMQQRLIAQGGFTLEGRDTTTVVAPDADLKVFLTASLEERTRRRHKELVQAGSDVELAELTRQISERDHRDYTRDESPLTKSPDAFCVESFGITPDEVAEKIIAHLNRP